MTPWDAYTTHYAATLDKENGEEKLTKFNPLIMMASSPKLKPTGHTDGYQALFPPQ